MRLDAKLAKVEQRAKVTLRCDWCRFSLRDMSPDEEKEVKTRPGDYVKVRCPYCGTEVTYNLASYSRRAREVFFILNGSTGDGSMYRDERVFAAQVWSAARRSSKPSRGSPRCLRKN